MKLKTIFNYFLITIIALSVLNQKAFSAVHFTESFTSPNFPVSDFMSGNFVLNSGTWDVYKVQGLEGLNAFNYSGGAVKLNRFLGAYLTSPSVNSVGTFSFYYRNYYLNIFWLNLLFNPDKLIIFNCFNSKIS
jgi:hypothetical protein